MVNALVSAQNKISAGELRPTLKPDASDQERAEYRKALGIPEAPEKYDLTFENGLVVGEEDKPRISEFLKAAHSSNMTPEQVKGAIKWWYETTEAQAAEQDKSDKEAKQRAEDDLRAEWGPDYRRNLNLYESFLDTLPKEGEESLKDLLRFGRLADGRPIGSHPGVIKWLANLALQINPLSTVVPGTGTDQMASIDTEIAGIEKTMRENRKAYNADDKMQSRYRELLGAREKMRARQGTQ